MCKGSKGETRNSKFEIRQSRLSKTSFEFRPPRRTSFAFLSILLLLTFPATASAQEEEVVANLAAGRVVVYVAKDGIVVATLEERIEAGARAPVIFPLSGRRVAILMGAVEWVTPGTAGKPVRMAEELRRVSGQVAGPQRLQDEHATDIEGIGIGLLEPLRAAAGRLHHKIELGAEEPLLELVLVGYAPDYGPEVWSLKYRIAQEPLRGDYWRTRVLRPSYTQLYPPEKGQPRRLVEMRYPPSERTEALIRLDDPRVARLRNSDASLARAAESLQRGESNKAKLDDATLFLRTALAAVTSPETAQAVAVIAELRGFEWVLAPADAADERAAEEKPREPGAPTLRKKP